MLGTYKSFIYLPEFPVSSMTMTKTAAKGSAKPGAKVEFEDIRFSRDDADVKMIFLRAFESTIPSADLKRIGEFTVRDNSIEFEGVSDKEAMSKFALLLHNAFSRLKNSVTGHPTVYIHQNSGIPLIGSLYFGIVDRGTNILEIKPITGCNINCSFCSVSEGKDSTRAIDYVVEKDYLVEELRQVIDFKTKTAVRDEDDKTDGKADNKIDVFINTQGEPLLYAPIVELVRDIRAMKQVRTISIITNATLLSKSLADCLVEAGLDQINISINAFDPDAAKKLAGTAAYDVRKVLDIAEYLSKRIKVIVAPVWIPGLNDDQMPKLIKFCKDIRAEIGIQNYLVHAGGRKIANQASWEVFETKLKAWETETGAELIFKGHSLSKTRSLPKPFIKGDYIKAEIVCPGRLRKEMLASARGRVISVLDCVKERGSIRIQIIKDKDNTFVAKEA